MGAGAGYNIKGTIDYDSIKINSFEVSEPFTVTEKLSGGYTQDYLIIKIKCDIDCAAEDIVSESYYDGGTLYGFTPIKITEVSLIPDVDDIEDIPEINESVIRDALGGLKFDVSLGWGWVHSKFDGDISCNTDELEDDGYTDFYFNEIVMHITSKIAVEVLDEYARGDNYGDEYRVVNVDGDTLEYFEDYDEAIAYAKENNGYEVWGSRQWYEYALTNGGDDVEVDIIDIDDDIGKDWTNPDYSDDD